MDVDSGGQVVVLAAADPDAEGEAAAREVVEGGGLLRQQCGPVQGCEQYLGLYADAVGGAGEGGQGDEWFGVRVGSWTGSGDRGGSRRPVGALA